jgi:hypothetical protein
MKITIPVVFVALLCLLHVHAGTIDPSQEDWHKRYKKQKNAPDPAKMLLNTDPEPDLKEGFTDLFNGKDLAGWKPKGGTCTFEVSDGAIVGTCVKGSPSTYLSTEREDYGDFVFTCDMKWEVDGNSGVMFRAQAKPGKKFETVYGPQVEMEDEGKGRGWSGGIYGQSCGGYWYPLWLKEHKDVRAARKNGEWNRVTLYCKGNVVKTWVNGVPAAHWVDEKNEYPKGFFSLQIHSGKQGQVLFKNIRIKELK